MNFVKALVVIGSLSVLAACTKKEEAPAATEQTAPEAAPAEAAPAAPAPAETPAH